MFSSSEHSTLASDLRCLDRFLAAKQVDAAALFARFGLDHNLLREPHARYPAQDVEFLLTEVSEQFGDAMLGLTLARHFRITDTHGLGVAVLSSANTLEALRELVANQALISTVEPFRLTENLGEIRLECVPSEMVLVRAASEEYLLKVVLDVLRLAAGAGFQPDRVGLTRPRPANIGHHLRELGCPVNFSQPMSYIAFTRVQAEMPFTTTNADLSDTLSPLLTRLLRAVPGEHYLAGVRRRLLMNRDIAADARAPIAEALSVSTEFLDEKLRESDIDADALLAALRCQLAELLLKSPALSEEEVAESCGYPDVANLRSALAEPIADAMGNAYYQGDLRQPGEQDPPEA